MSPRRPVLPASVAAVVAACLAACGAPPVPGPTAVATWCDEVPRPANEAFPRVAGASPWYQVYRVAPGVLALVEPRQFQEAIAYLVTGTQRALLFDSGIGLVPIRPVVAALTPLPVTVVNSHTHYDHVGGNAEFDDVRALDTPYTRRNQGGFAHDELAGEVAATSFCGAPPAGADTAAFRTRPWRASAPLRDGERLDLGGRTLEVLHVPGHTPDALALRDSANGLLWTGDTFYEAPIWLFVPETDLDAYERSLERLVALAPTVRHLLPAHNLVRADPARLAVALRALRAVRRGAVPATDVGNGQLTFRTDSVTFLTARAVLEGRAVQGRSGSGLARP